MLESVAIILPETVGLQHEACSTHFRFGHGNRKCHMWSKIGRLQWV